MYTFFGFAVHQLYYVFLVNCAAPGGQPDQHSRSQAEQHRRHQGNGKQDGGAHQASENTGFCLKNMFLFFDNIILYHIILEMLIYYSFKETRKQDVTINLVVSRGHIR